MPPPHTLSASNASVYTLDTVYQSDYEDDDLTPLRSAGAPSYGALPRSSSRTSSRRVIFNATLKMAAIFVVSTIFLGGTLWLALPTLEDVDRDSLRIPKSFAQLQALNTLLKKYRDIYPYRIFVCYVTTYLFLQAFSLPGSMYLSILGGAVWGVPFALPLACVCVASGATLCYLISAALGPALLTIPKFRALLTKWSVTIAANKANIISYLIVLRIAPLPPHWVVNVVCPHVGIGLAPFWISTALGILGVTVIHTTIGGGLDEMTSADDFHLISWKNFLGLSAVVVGVMIPVGLRYWFRQEADAIAEETQSQATEDEDEDRILAVGPNAPSKAKDVSARLLVHDDEYDEYDDDDDDDIILEAGPVISMPKERKDGNSDAHTGSSL
ncbi:uncharacterized protein BT62DRAFT_926617 [Guyanagaster necrorhizus]|uniref:VTT domain-containing protein n=1 Tax=Guyanagaster necrorhizus TaxID=856835 RepID=A0A9P8AWR2_9AGAR|nr:uncharacterized protein BT62DRAFT_926617 [Guyanagaster necrorhizus MCA 3950]KAG7450949.1 hypothetical protein BT62DRAFT_926617 [Guyanagaster necrorhizus MCA 3950]